MHVYHLVLGVDGETSDVAFSLPAYRGIIFIEYEDFIFSTNPNVFVG